MPKIVERNEDALEALERIMKICDKKASQPPKTDTNRYEIIDDYLMIRNALITNAQKRG